MVAIADQTGIVKQRMRYDPWGGRIAVGAMGDPYLEERGYAGHEHLDEVGLIHMNGRIYDPISGRFVQADPIVQSPLNGQSYNRYSYVVNNPLSLTDPSGFAWRNSVWNKRGIRFATSAMAAHGDFGGAWINRKFDYGAIQNPDVRMAGAIVASIFTYGAASEWAASETIGAAAAGFAAGGIQGGNLQTAIYGAFTGAVTAGVFAGVAAGIDVIQEASAGSVYYAENTIIATTTDVRIYEPKTVITGNLDYSSKTCLFL